MFLKFRNPDSQEKIELVNIDSIQFIEQDRLGAVLTMPDGYVHLIMNNSRTRDSYGAVKSKIQESGSQFITLHRLRLNGTTNEILINLKWVQSVFSTVRSKLYRQCGTPATPCTEFELIGEQNSALLIEESVEDIANLAICFDIDD